MRGTLFGKVLKQFRQRQHVTLREFCLRHGFDPGNYSRVERGLFPAPQSTDVVEKYAVALGLKRGSDDWVQLFDAAAASRGQLPSDLLSDEELLRKLPVLFRTLRGSPVPAEKLDELVAKVRKR